MLLIVLLLLVICRVSTFDDITCIYDAQNVCANCTILYNMENITEISSNSATDMTICINTIELQEVIMISNKSSLVISGMKSIIKCSKNNSGVGLHLHNITNLEMHNMEFTYCGANEFDHQYGIINFCVLIRYCTDIMIANVNITNSEKTGVTMLHNGGMILIKQSNFMSNGNWEKSEEDCDENQKETDKTHHGGGMQIILAEDDNAYDMKILDCVFMNNSACKGGGIDIIYHNYQYQENSSLLLSGSDFLENNAYYGGGVRIEFKHTSCSTIYNGSVIFNTCRWQNNSAFGGAAIEYVSRNISACPTLPTVQMINCSYTLNHNFAIKTLKRYYAGALWINALNVSFHGKHAFTDNNNTAMFLISANIHFQSGSDVIFTRNRGTKGGAIHLSDSSILFIEDNSTFIFSNNTATEKGGAIYNRVNSYKYFYSPGKCFIQYIGDQNDVSERRIKFVLEISDNEKNVPIYTSTLKRCQKHYNNCSENNTLHCIANFSGGIISTSGYEIYKEKDEIYVIPGYRTKLPVKLLDELGREIPAQFSASVTPHDPHDKSNIEIDEAYTFTSHNWIKILGKPGIDATLRLAYSEVWTVATEITVTLQECPPGYYLEKTRRVCVQ